MMGNITPVLSSTESVESLDSMEHGDISHDLTGGKKAL